MHVEEWQLYRQFHWLFAVAAWSVLAKAPLHSEEAPHRLLPYLVRCFCYFSSGATFTERVVTCKIRRWIEMEELEGRGWSHGSTAAERSRQRPFHEEIDHVRRKGGSRKERDEAQASAEAGSHLKCIVPVKSMAHRQFRIQAIEPLLATSSAMAVTAEDMPFHRSVEVWSPKPSMTAEEQGRRRRLMADVDHMLKMIGFPPDHAARVQVKGLM